jgi:hypothetical protein
MTIKKIITATFLLTVFSIPASTAAINSADLAHCAKITDDSERLACFDLLTTTAKKVQPLPIKKVMVEKKSPTYELAVNIKPTTSLTATFGQTQQIKQKLNVVEFTIKSAKLSLRKKWQLTFTNGQVWHAIELNSSAKFKVEDVVIIKRSFLNSFLLKKKGTKRSIRVKRIS